MGRRPLSFSDRADIAVSILAGKTDRQIGVDLGRDHTIIWRERGRNSTKTRGYRPVSADCAAERRRSRPQARKIETDPVLRTLDTLW
ncbi:helix-turn-helix domain-containing protein [Arthrobacter sp. lap29]|uniref:helix-turn-helix domain-containing protein n=1 Tax=Arthrobacter sp. lap29 TaxID=3056122 RepID=UPI0028F71691|nr:helix-turn-helix domain-containing protein [Arthrobacter sp. lap29]